MRNREEEEVKFWNGINIGGKSAMGVIGGSREINKVAPAITPTLGAELLTDGGLENWLSATNLTSWIETIAGASTVNQDTDAGDIHGGTSAARLDVDASNSVAAIDQTILTIGLWYQISAWVKGSAGNPVMMFGDRNGSGVMVTIDTNYTQRFVTYRTTHAGVRYGRNAAPSVSLFVDDASVKALTLSSCLALIGDIHRKNGTYQCTPTVTAGTATGMVIEYKDINNFVVAWTDGINAKLESCIGGTWTIVKTGAITYGAAKILKVVVNGTTHQLFYDGLQVSTNGTIDNSGLGTQVHGFNTYAGNSVGTVTTNP